MLLANQFIRTEYKTIDAYRGTDEARHCLETTPALIVTDGDRYVGCLTCRDIAVNPRTLVIDCLRSAQNANPRMPIVEVLALMRDAQSPALPVIDEGRCVGILFQEDIIDCIRTDAEERQQEIYAVAHDLKAPLSNMSALTSMLGRPLAPGDHERAIEHMQHSCGQLTATINTLLAEGSTAFRAVAVDADINALVRECVVSLEAVAAAKKVAFVDNLDVRPVIISVHPDELRRAIQNVLSNAIKFTPEGGIVQVSTSYTAELVQICVKDNGIGIPEHMRTAIFRKFTEATRYGTEGERPTGLGMHITRQIIERHGGSIRFESDPGEGTTFFIELMR